MTDEQIMSTAKVQQFDDEDFDIFQDSKKKDIGQSAVPIDQSMFQTSVNIEENRSNRISQLSSKIVIDSEVSKSYVEKIQEIHQYLQRGTFAQLLASTQQFILRMNENEEEPSILDESMNVFLNECMIFASIKLKEFKHAR